MQAIILAAGMGKRLGEQTEDNTKCMVKVDGERIIDRMLRVCHEANISKIILVIGYKAEKIIKYIGDSYKGIPVTYIENKDYDKTNNIYSLFLGKVFLAQDDTLLLESDIIFDDKLVIEMLKDPRADLAAVSSYKSWMDGTAVTIDSDDNILNFVSKKELDYSNLDRYFKTVNIYKFSKKFSNGIYVPFLKAYSESLGKNEYYEQVLRVIASLEEKFLKAFRVPENILWYEIDNLHDLSNAEVLFSTNSSKIENLNKRFGGYWRFPTIKDFCYLVNPYFPCQQMLNEMQCHFSNLITEYPSGLDVQNTLAADMYGCRNGQLVVGNGASELIDALFKALGDSVKIGLPRPTFDEYPSRIPPHSLVPFCPGNGKIHYGLSELLDFVRGVDVFVLINPDNPSGNYLLKEEVLLLAKEMQSMGKLLVLDESFVDFSHEGSEATLLKMPILEEFENLVVIKSISKSYGVPGLRLGVLGASDKGLLAKIKRALPIWNINSMGEFFLQIFKKYESDYFKACSKISHERDRFYDLLRKFNGLKAYPSQANYFLCEITHDISAYDLSVKLLEKHNILIKVCTQKDGVEGKEFIRIAIRDKQDNDCLIESLRAVFGGC